MKRMTIGSALAALALAACATATTYAPAARVGEPGFSETRIEQNRYRVTFAGNSATPKGAVEDYALRRAAELTVQNGFDWFQAVAGGTSAERASGGSSVGVGLGGGSFGGRGGVGGGVGLNLGGGGANQRYVSTLEVVMGAGPKPEGANVYDAQGVLNAIPTDIPIAR